MTQSDLAAFLKSHTFGKLLAVIGALIIVLGAFYVGMAVGFHKAEFAGHWEENYSRNFGPSETAGVPGRMMPNPHGAVGRIVSVTLPTFVIAGQGEDEKTVRIGADTLIKGTAGDATSTDIMPGMQATVIGSPNDAGEIDARLIRLMPAPSAAPTPAVPAQPAR